MPELTLENIEQVSLDIRMQEIILSHLPEELTDHICCDIEYEMQRGKSFQEAYNIVRQKIGKRRLKEIQEETLYAVDTKYRQMKTTMKISGVTGTIMLGFAVLLKIQHWAGAGVLMTLGSLTLALVFLPSALSVLWKETHNSKRLFTFISAFLTGACFIAGTLFKIQHWAGAGPILILGTVSGILLFIPALLINRLNNRENKIKRPVYIIGAAGCILYFAGMFFKIQHWQLSGTFIFTGLIILCFVALPWYIWITWKDESYVSSRFIFIIIGFLLIIIPGALLNLNLQQSYQDHYYLNINQQDALHDYLTRSNSSFVSSYKDSLSYGRLDQLHTRTTDLISTLSNIGEKMVRESEGEPGKPSLSADQIVHTDTGSKILFSKLSKPFMTIPVTDNLLPGCGSRQEINRAASEYLDYLNSLISREETDRYKKLLDPSTYLPDGDPDKVQLSLMAGLHSLEVMKNGILTAESCVLKDIARPK